MRNRFFALLSGIATAATLSSCATMLDRTTQTIEVYTPGVEMVDCILDTPEHRYRLLTPNKARVEKSRFDIVATCTKAGYEDAIRTLHPKISGNAFWNVFNGVIPGTSYDIASNAIYLYPSKIEIDMIPLAPKDVVFKPVEDSKDDVEVISEPVTQEEPLPIEEKKPYAASDADKAFDAGRK